jgi:hypothetical protein
MKYVCFVVQRVYDVDLRVRRKAEALVAAGYSVDALALRAPQGKKSYTLNGVNVHIVSLGKAAGVGVHRALLVRGTLRFSGGSSFSSPFAYRAGATR